jgi:exosortase
MNTSLINRLVWPVGLAALWLITWNGLRYEWQTRAIYEYGYAIPPLSLFLFWLRWTSRPGYSPARPFYTSPVFSVILGLVAVTFAVGELLRQHDPSWRVGCGLLMVGAIFVTAAWLYRLGGRRLLFHQAFPLAFTWLGVPWPRGLEVRIVASLSELVAATTTDILNLGNWVATRHGNVIELSTGWVGLDTACTGVQSLQTSLMASLFLGEVLHLRNGRRLALLLTGVGLALAFNIARVFGLAVVLSGHGVATMDRWHDTIGMIASGCTFGLLGLTAWFFVGRRLPTHQPVATQIPLFSNSAPRIARDGIWVLSAVLGALFLPPVWFHLFGGDSVREQAGPNWNLRPPGMYENWRIVEHPIRPAERRELEFTKGDAVELAGPSGQTGVLYHFFWQPGERPPMTAYAHTPGVCMPSVGWQSCAPATASSLTVHGQTMSGRLHLFQQDQRRIAVFQSVFPKPYQASVYADCGRWERLELLWKAPRQRVAEVLLLYIPMTDASTDIKFWGESALSVALATNQSVIPPKR